MKYTLAKVMSLAYSSESQDVVKMKKANLQTNNF